MLIESKTFSISKVSSLLTKWKVYTNYYYLQIVMIFVGNRDYLKEKISILKINVTYSLLGYYIVSDLQFYIF